MFLRATDIRGYKDSSKPSPLLSRFFFLSRIATFSSWGRHHLPREYHPRLTLASSVFDALISLEPTSIISRWRTDAQNSTAPRLFPV